MVAGVMASLMKVKRLSRHAADAESDLVIDAEGRECPRPHIDRLLEGVVRIRLPAMHRLTCSAVCERHGNVQYTHVFAASIHRAKRLPPLPHAVTWLYRPIMWKVARALDLDRHTHFSTSPLRACDRFQGSSADAPFSLASFSRAASMIGFDRSYANNASPMMPEQAELDMFS